MPKLKKETSYQRLKKERDMIFEEILCLIQRPDSIDAETIRIKYNYWLEQNEEFVWIEGC